jgi:serine/threonine protein kinase
LDLFESSNHYYIVLEYMQGKDLFDYIAKRSYQLPEERAKVVIFQVLQGVRYLHRFGIVHRDLKLENIMMSNATDRAVPKIVDFGLSKIIGPNETATEPFGTLGYVAPEVLKKQPYSYSCDMWSIGCILYALISGSLPFDHNNQKELMRMTMDDTLKFDLPIWDNISSQCKNLITDLLKKNSSQRIRIEEAMLHPWFDSARVKLNEQ